MLGEAPKLEPVIVIKYPPAVIPEVGLMAEITGKA
jgi:hypothetical protein